MDYFVKSELLTKAHPAENKKAEPYRVFSNINFGIKKGEFITCIGHSGCGKSTLLNILAGLDKPTDGVTLLGSKAIDGPSLDRAVVFQNHSLLPWQSALQNVLFAVKAKFKNKSKNELRDHAMQYMKLVGLEKSLDKKPYQLSGGMRQRVGIARAFAVQSELLLMDEPFGALDALTRGVIQDQLIEIWSRTKQTVFMITHDVDEAILLSDRIFLMSNGPDAVISESVKVSIPRPRNRMQIVHHPDYYKIRNHLIDFLVTRSSQRDDLLPDGTQVSGIKEGKLVYPPVVDPTIEKKTEFLVSA